MSKTKDICRYGVACLSVDTVAARHFIHCGGNALLPRSLASLEKRIKRH